MDLISMGLLAGGWSGGVPAFGSGTPAGGRDLHLALAPTTIARVWVRAVKILGFSGAAALVLAACASEIGPRPTPPPAPDLTSTSSNAAADDDDADAPDDTGKPPDAWAKEAATKITAHAKGKTRAWDRLALMVDRYGHRLSGSKALEQSIDWAVETMAADGLDNARREKVMVPHWVRGKESLKIISPARRDVIVLGLGMSVGTRGSLRGELAVVDHVDAIAKAGDELKGKVVLIAQAMPPYDKEKRDSGYGPTVAARTRGASEAAKKGAKAVLVRSVTANSLQTPHTGSLRYEDDVKKIPAAAVTPEGSTMLQRMAARGKVTVELRMGARTLPDVPSANAIAELRGREKPEEVVVIGGHIDSWDVGDGATDDGAGCLMAMEAALMLKELGLVPKRTIRVVLFTNEENGLRGAKAYFEAHGEEVHVGAIEADAGSGAPYGFSVKAATPEEVDDLKRYAPLFKGLGAHHIEAGWGGADISPLTDKGVLGIAVRPDGSHYFDLHHSPADTVEKIDPDHLQRNAAAMALLAYILAER